MADNTQGMGVVGGRNPLIKDDIHESLEACREYAEFLAGAAEEVSMGYQLAQCLLLDALGELSKAAKDVKGN